MKLGKNNFCEKIYRVSFLGRQSKKVDLLLLIGYIPAMFVCIERKLLLFCLILMLLVMPSGVVEAQKKKAIVIEEIKIEGTIQKPEVMTFLSRARFSYRTLELDVTFTEKVEKAIHVDEAF